jgi:pilus assembly protein Flp/PilA
LAFRRDHETGAHEGADEGEETMSTIMTVLSALRRDEKGATAIEYGLIATLIAVAIIAIVTTVGGDLVNTFTDVSTGLSGAS